MTIKNVTMTFEVDSDFEQFAVFLNRTELEQLIEVSQSLPTIRDELINVRDVVGSLSS